MTDENGFLRPEAFQERVAEIKANKTADGYGPALAKAFDALPDVQKPSFLFASKDIDPLRKAFGAGHAATSTLLTVGTTVPAVVIGLMKGSFLNPLTLSGGCIGFTSATFSHDQRSASQQEKTQCRMMDVEYAMWRMAQVEKGEIAPIKALGAGLLNGFKHNAVSMMARGVVIVAGALVCGVAKGLAVLSRGLFGSSEISKTTQKCQNASDKIWRPLQSVPGKSYCLAKDADMPLVTERLMVIRDAAYIRRKNRVACLGPDA